MTEKSEWKRFQEWFWERQRKRAGKWTPHEKEYNDIILSSESFEEAEQRLLKMQEEYDLPLLSDFYRMYDMFREEERRRFTAEDLILLSPFGPLYLLGKIVERVTTKQGEGKTSAPQESDTFEMLQSAVMHTLSSFELAINSTDCPICKGLLEQIKTLPLEQQVVALEELHKYMELAGRGEDVQKVKEYLETTEILKVLIKKLEV